MSDFIGRSNFRKLALLRKAVNRAVVITEHDAPAGRTLKGEALDQVWEWIDNARQGLYDHENGVYEGNLTEGAIVKLYTRNGKPVDFGKRTKTVRVTLSVTVDVDDWQNTFKIDEKDIADDVRTYVHSLAQGGALGNGEIDATVELKH